MVTLVALLILVLALNFYVTKNSSFLKGRVGENFVTHKLRDLDPAHYVVIPDLLIPSAGPLETTQIDHVVISNYGVFCIETKTYSGQVFGDAFSPVWTQAIFHYKKNFKNPIRQNYGHVLALKALLGTRFPNLVIQSLIVFPAAQSLRIDGTDMVGTASEVIQKIKSFDTSVITDAEKGVIVEILLSSNIRGSKARRHHQGQVSNLTLKS